MKIISFLSNCLICIKVSIGKDGSLYALESGKVVITCEKFQPNFSNYWVNKTFADRKGNMSNVYKKYFNVIADPLEPKFKLIDQV